jgi:hypothetical protein
MFLFTFLLLWGTLWRNWCFGRGDLECAEGAGPDLIEVGAEARDAGRIELIEAAGSVPGIEHEARFFEDAEMLRDRGPADGHDGGELVDGERTVGETVEDGHAGGIREGVEAGL